MPDYFPCACSLESNIKVVKVVSCDGVSVGNVRDVFQRVNDPDIYELRLTLLPDEETNTIFLPADFLGNTSVTSYIYISGNSNYPSLVIDPLAFRSSQNSLTKFNVKNLDFGLQEDFNFLNGFNKLEALWISYIKNLTAFQYLPPLPSFQELQVALTPSELNQIAFPDLRSAKLKHL